MSTRQNLLTISLLHKFIQQTAPRVQHISGCKYLYNREIPWSVFMRIWSANKINALQHRLVTGHDHAHWQDRVQLGLSSHLDRSTRCIQQMMSRHAIQQTGTVHKIVPDWYVWCCGANRPVISKGFLHPTRNARQHTNLVCCRSSSFENRAIFRVGDVLRRISNAPCVQTVIDSIV